MFFDSIVQEPRVFPFARIRSFLGDAVRRRLLSPEERREPIRTDLFVQGKYPEAGATVHLVVEVSWSVYRIDVGRAALLCKLDVPVFAVMAGMGIAPEAHREAPEHGGADDRWRGGTPCRSLR